MRCRRTYVLNKLLYVTYWIMEAKVKGNIIKSVKNFLRPVRMQKFIDVLIFVNFCFIYIFLSLLLSLESYVSIFSHPVLVNLSNEPQTLYIT